MSILISRGFDKNPKIKQDIKTMRYRDIIINNVDVLESQLKTLRRMVQRGESIKEFTATLDQADERLEKVKSYVQLEPKSPNEVGGN